MFNRAYTSRYRIAYPEKGMRVGSDAFANLAAFLYCHRSFLLAKLDRCRLLIWSEDRACRQHLNQVRSGFQLFSCSLGSSTTPSVSRYMPS
jgi:hypothetical protein